MKKDKIIEEIRNSNKLLDTFIPKFSNVGILAADSLDIPQLSSSPLIEQSLLDIKEELSVLKKNIFSDIITSVKEEVKTTLKNVQNQSINEKQLQYQHLQYIIQQLSRELFSSLSNHLEHISNVQKEHLQNIAENQKKILEKLQSTDKTYRPFEPRQSILPTKERLQSKSSQTIKELFKGKTQSFTKKSLEIERRLEALNNLAN